MLKPFLKNYQEKKLFNSDDSILIATSGGIDSMVLCHLFHLANLKFGIAHCNYQLRGEDSDLDAELVAKIAYKYEVPFFEIKFETKKFAEEKKESIQLIARNLRYDWLENIQVENNYQFIATAHHLNDSVETFLYNFSKGSGLRGLHGIPEINGKIIRPLLFASKSEITAFAKKEKLEFREDASNAENKYARNKIRNKVIPILKELNPNFDQTANATIQKIKEAEKLYDFALDILKKEVVQTTENEWQIDIKKLQSSPTPSTLLFEILKPFGFNSDQIEQILQNIDSQAGKQFHSNSFSLLRDRFFLKLKKKENSNGVKFIINNINEILKIGNGESLQFFERSNPEKFPLDSNQIFMDLSKVKFPLTLRKWESGDIFQPFGMNGKHQKLQDFFSNQKLSLFEKEKVWILETDGKICWVVGQRLDERFKVSKTTKSCLFLEFKPATFAK